MFCIDKLHILRKSHVIFYDTLRVTTPRQVVRADIRIHLILLLVFFFSGISFYEKKLPLHRKKNYPVKIKLPGSN